MHVLVELFEFSPPAIQRLYGFNRSCAVPVNVSRGTILAGSSHDPGVLRLIRGLSSCGAALRPNGSSSSSLSSPRAHVTKLFHGAKARSI